VNRKSEIVNDKELTAKKKDGSRTLRHDTGGQAKEENAQARAQNTGMEKGS
jgi:hypothetical protein